MITSSNILYIYCEIMEQLEPKRVLDVGMFYKAVGGVSRRILNREVPSGCYITAVRTDKTENLGVYSAVYNKIVDIEELDVLKDVEFDLAVMLSDAVSLKDRQRLISRISGRCMYLLTYEYDVPCLEAASDIKSIRLGEDRCVLAVFE